MKWFNLFLLIGVLAIFGGMSNLTAAEPLPLPGPGPEPKGRPLTTRRPRSDNDENRR